MGTNIADGYFSADGHVVEPGDLWTTRMDKRFRDRAPYVDSRSEGDYYMIDGLVPLPVGLEGVSMEEKLAGKVTKFIGRHAETRPGANDPQARLVDQDMDHIRAEVIYPGLGLFLSVAPDPEYRRECFRVYNEWLGEFCGAAPNRLIGVGLLPMKGPIQWAIEEAERAAKNGLLSVGIPTEVAGTRYGEAHYDPLWDALQDLGLPVSLHVGMDEAFHTKTLRLGTGVAFVDTKICSMERAMAGLIWGAVAKRYPKLRFVLAEGGIGWIASILGTMDHYWSDHKHWMEPKTDELPSTYFKRQFWATFEEDRAGILTRELVGSDRLLWGSDYPHTEGTFPYSEKQIKKDFAGVPENEVYQMVVSNAAGLYGIDV